MKRSAEVAGVADEAEEDGGESRKTSMKRSAEEAGVADEDDEDGGESRKTSKFDDGDGRPRRSELSIAGPDASPTDSGKAPAAEHAKARGGSKKGGASKAAPPSSPLHSDDDGEGRNRGDDTREGGAGGVKGDGAGDDDDDDERMENFELGKVNAVDPGRMQQVLDRFTPEQMSRYECYRRSGFQRAIMRRLLGSVAGCSISIPMTIVMSGISKMFVGELVEVGRIVMTERNDVGPIRPCHIREAYRRLKLEGKVPVRGRAPLFR